MSIPQPGVFIEGTTAHHHLELALALMEFTRPVSGSAWFVPSPADLIAVAGDAG